MASSRNIERANVLKKIAIDISLRGEESIGMNEMIELEKVQECLYTYGREERGGESTYVYNYAKMGVVLHCLLPNLIGLGLRLNRRQLGQLLG